MRVLAVDDSASMRDLVSSTLSNAGMEVEQAKDGVDALEMARKGAFDVVLADLNMPRMDGIQLIRELRADARYRLTPILMLTTESSEQKRREGKVAGATGWIVKPFEPDGLVSALRRVMR
jgi:two-component system, chemotaxis family, chemotaxis protein CheY